jgi:hypothetical protein
VSELGNSSIVKLFALADCEIGTVWPATFKEPLLLCGLVLAATAQFTVLPETEAVAHGTLEIAVTGQLDGVGVTDTVPEEAVLPKFRLATLSV